MKQRQNLLKEIRKDGGCYSRIWVGVNVLGRKQHESKSYLTLGLLLSLIFLKLFVLSTYEWIYYTIQK